MDEELAYAERATLLRIIAELREQVSLLTGQVQTLTVRVAELEQRDPPSWVKANRPKPTTGRPKRKPRETAFVRRREPPTVVVEHAADQCPDCGTELSGVCASVTGASESHSTKRPTQ